MSEYDKNKWSVSMEKEISAPAEKVWAQMTNPEQFGTPLLRRTRLITGVA